MAEDNGNGIVTREIKIWKSRSLKFGVYAACLAIFVSAIALADKFITTQGEGVAIKKTMDSTFTVYEFRHQQERWEDKQMFDSLFREIKDIKDIVKKPKDEN